MGERNRNESDAAEDDERDAFLQDLQLRHRPLIRTDAVRRHLKDVCRKPRCPSSPRIATKSALLRNFRWAYRARFMKISGQSQQDDGLHARFRVYGARVKKQSALVTPPRV